MATHPIKQNSLPAFSFAGKQMRELHRHDDGLLEALLCCFETCHVAPLDGRLLQHNGARQLVPQLFLLGVFAFGVTVALLAVFLGTLAIADWFLLVSLLEVGFELLRPVEVLHALCSDGFLGLVALRFICKTINNVVNV